MSATSNAHGYRPDIDGLRAIAVLAVVLFHAGVPGISGGFVGVDIFFVISGYLITSIIAREIASGSFSLLTFYERRTRRIFPALFAMLAASLAVAMAIQLPNELVEFANSLVAAALFVSNIFFWQTTDYFGGPAHVKPLLHTWSLAVEEQFYIVFPLLLMALAKWGRGRTLRVLVPLTALSFALSVFAVSAKPTAAFYLLPTRFWELMVGALLALGAVPAIRSAFLRDVAGAAGLGLIAIGVFGVSSTTPFPGLAALVPCLGAALIIHSGATGRPASSRLLSTRPLVFVGLISYSLYLWHWPIFAFSRIVQGAPPSGIDAAGLVILSFVLAVLSWRFIERPFRERTWANRRPELFRMAAVGMSALLAIGLAAAQQGGWTSRHPDYKRPDIAGLKHMRLATCFLKDDQAAGEWAGIGACSAGPAGAPKVLVWGDSFAAHLVPGLEALAASDVRIIQVTAGGCPPVLGLAPANRPHCRAFNDQALALIAHNEPDAVLISARWEAYVPRMTDLDALRRTVAAVRALGPHVIVVSDQPTFDFSHPYDAVYRSGKAASVPLPTRAATAETLHALFSDDAGVSVFDTKTRLCPDGTCPLVSDGGYLYFDGGHLSVHGSSHVARGLLPLLPRGRNGPALSAVQ